MICGFSFLSLQKKPHISKSNSKFTRFYMAWISAPDIVLPLRTHISWQCNKPETKLKEEVTAYHLSTIFSRHKYKHLVINIKLTAIYKDEIQYFHKSFNTLIQYKDTGIILIISLWKSYLLIKSLFMEKAWFNSLDHIWLTVIIMGGFPGGSAVKNLPDNVRDAGSIPGSERSLGEGNGNPLQPSCLENPLDREAWQAMVHRVARSRTFLSN